MTPALQGLDWVQSAYIRRSLHLDLTQTSLVLGGATLFGGIVSMTGAAFLADRICGRSMGSYAVIPGCGCLATLLFLLITLNANSVLASLIALVGIYRFSQAFGPPSVALVQNLVPAQMRATA